MLMQRRLCLRTRRHRMCCLREMVMPVGMRRTPAMPMHMDVAREQGRIAPQRRIKRILGRIRSMVMVMGKPAVNMIMLGEPGLKHMCLAAMFECHDNIEFVRLGNLFDRLPVSSMICKKKNLTLPAGAQGLDPDGISLEAGHAKPRRNTCLVINDTATTE